MSRWHVITGTYPPRPGGVADYTALLARALAAEGCEVHVWSAGDGGESVAEPGVTVHRVVGRFGLRGLARLGRELNRFPGPRTLLVQYVPHGFGCKAMNVPFAAWVLARRLRHGDDIRVMFHEVAFPWVHRPLRHNLIAAANRLMAALLLQACSHADVSIPGWVPMLHRLGGRRVPIAWTPIPANIPADPPSGAVAARRAELTGGEPGARVVGHFGTYGAVITPGLAPALGAVLSRRPDVRVLLLGAGGDRWRETWLRDRPDWARRVVATGALPEEAVAEYLAACDLALQPYPDGASSRRTSLMAALANGVPVVTTLGALSEPVWSAGAVAAAVRGVLHRRPHRGRAAGPRRTRTELPRMTAPRRLLTVSHSYVVALNRRLADEMARAGRGRWDVTAVSPRFMRGDLRPVPLEPLPGEACRLEAVRVYGSRSPHLMAYGRRLKELLRGGWDLVHSWEEPYVVAGFQVARWTPPRVPLVFWTAQNLSKRYPPPFAWFERYCVRRCAGWLACGRTTADTLARRGYSAKPHRVMPLGVDLAAFRPDRAAGAAVRRALGWDAGGPPVVGYLGRFVPEKGLPLLMRALDAVAGPWRALFVGGGPLESTLRSWAARHADRVRVVTGVPHDKVPAYLNGMDVLAAPSQTTPRWREQFGRMLVEAFACGVPVAGSDSGEIPFVIADAGLVLPEQDEAAWSRRLAELLENPARRTELSARGREHAEQFAWPAVARRHLEFFESVLD